MTHPLQFRPHHFMCTLGFEGKGYSPKFVENFQAIADRLKGQGGDDVVIEVTSQTDSVCMACPHQQGPLCGSDQESVHRLDVLHGAALGLQQGDQITWGEAKQRIIAHVDEKVFDTICVDCRWKSLGVCLSALKSLRGE